MECHLSFVHIAKNTYWLQMCLKTPVQVISAIYPIETLLFLIWFPSSSIQQNPNADTPYPSEFA